MKLSLLSPHRSLVSSDSVKWVTLPGELGEMTILPEHAPLITNLNSGVLSYQDQEKTYFVAVHWGCASVENNEVIVLADIAELANEIDLDRAKTAEKKAQNKLLSTEEKRGDYYEMKLVKAITRQNIAKRS